MTQALRPFMRRWAAELLMRRGVIEIRQPWNQYRLTPKQRNSLKH
jgi:hypothetical protein